jgi:hypothetical protein
MPQLGALELFFECFGNKRWLGKEEGVKGKNVG